MNDHGRPAPNANPAHSPRALGLWLVVFLISLCLVTAALGTADPPGPQKETSPPPKPSVPPPTQPAPPPKRSEKKPPKKMSGAELYALHCNRCHPERHATERTAEQWKTILLHMRASGLVQSLESALRL
jgi:hypothetical protein